MARRLRCSIRASDIPAVLLLPLNLLSLRLDNTSTPKQLVRNTKAIPLPRPVSSLRMASSIRSRTASRPDILSRATLNSNTVAHRSSHLSNGNNNSNSSSSNNTNQATPKLNPQPSSPITTPPYTYTQHQPPPATTSLSAVPLHASTPPQTLKSSARQ